MSDWIKNNASSVRLYMAIGALAVGGICSVVIGQETIKSNATKVEVTSDKVRSMEMAQLIYDSEMTTVKANFREIKEGQKENAKKLDAVDRRQASLETSIKDMKETQKANVEAFMKSQRIIQEDIKKLLQNK